MKIYLASSSPRRKELLKQFIGDNFEIIKSDYEEDNTLKMPPKKLVVYHAVRKGRDAAQRLKKGIVISADTLVIYDKKVFGKPKSLEDAKNMLRKISGKNVDVITGYSVIDIGSKTEIHGSEITKVKIGKLTDSIIDSYVNTGEPLDKAGAFGVQGKGAIFIEKIDGCYYNVLGLPLYRLNEAFNKLGFSVFEIKQ